MTFQWPYLLFSLFLLPVLAGLYLWSQRRRRLYAMRFTNLALLASVTGPHPGVRRHIPPLLYLLGLGALLLSAARPTAVIAVPRDAMSVMLVMDVSGSMAADDLQPSRMEAAKQAASAFVKSLPWNVGVGLVSFSSGANLEAQPGADRAEVLQSINRLEADGGTYMGRALDVALDQLEDQADKQGSKPSASVVVLLSDGAPSPGDDPASASERARRMQVLVHTVGVGQHGATPLIDGRRSVPLDEQTLQEIARTTEGTYFYAAEADQLERIYADLVSRISWVEEETEVTALISGAGALVLMLAGLLSMYWFQKLP